MTFPSPLLSNPEPPAPPEGGAVDGMNMNVAVGGCVSVICTAFVGAWLAIGAGVLVMVLAVVTVGE